MTARSLGAAFQNATSGFAAERLMLQAADHLAIEQLIRRERLARDTRDWDGLAACYAAHSRVEISWFSGTGAEFVTASAASSARPVTVFHETGAIVVTGGHGRALTDTAHVVHVVADLDGMEVDCVGHIRVRARVELGEDGWKIAGLRGLYVHDMFVPTNPSRVPSIAPERLARYRRSYRCLSYMLDALGLAPRHDLPGIDQPEGVRALIAAEEAWLLS